MKKITRYLATVALLMCTVGSGRAQEVSYEAYPHMFVGVQGGLNLMATDDFNFGKLVAPVGQLSFGAYFNPVLGSRIAFQGWSVRNNYSGSTYKFNYFTTNVDLLVNLSNLLAERKHSVFNVILFGGVGVNYAWDNNEFLALCQPTEKDFAWENNLLNLNGHLGLQLDFDISKLISINAEGGLNIVSDRYNSKNGGGCDYQFYGLVGLAFKFGQKKVVKKAPVIEEPAPVVVQESRVDTIVLTKPEEWKTVIDTIWYDETDYVTKDVTDTIVRNVIYPLKGADPEAARHLRAIAEFVENHRNCTVDVKAYADRGTGNSRRNFQYSEQRRAGTVKTLIEFGVPINIITSQAYGDTVQPFAENDLNRVSIVTAIGQTTKREPVITHKFRTVERTIRVQ